MEYQKYSMITKILKIFVFLIIFSSCYFFSCQGLSIISQNACEEACSRFNIECCKDCEHSYQMYHTSASGNGCDGRYNNCIQKCQEMYNSCIDRCRVKKDNNWWIKFNFIVLLKTIWTPISILFKKLFFMKVLQKVLFRNGL